MSSPKTVAIPIVPLRIGSEPETGYAPLLPQSIGSDLQASAGSLRRLIPKAPPVPYTRPPKPPFEMPKWGKNVVFTPYVWKLLQKEGIEAVDAAKTGLRRVKNDLEYLLPNPYEGLINEAVNRHISRDKQ